MLTIKKRGLFETTRVVYLPTGELRPREAPRANDNPAAMRELAESVAKYGVLQPITVRRGDGGFELISGARRLRAAKLSGLAEVPCIILDVDEEESAALAIVENLQHRGLDFVEEARALRRLVAQYGYSQEQLAHAVGLSQPAVANKLRLLKLPASLLELARDLSLTERHARALLRLATEGDMEKALAEIAREGMTVTRADAYIDALVTGRPAPEPEPERGKIIFAIRDIRFFLNTIERAADVMRRAGLTVTVTRTEDVRQTVVTITIIHPP
jgi:ParB family chromosome partitioning protein